MNPRTRMVRVRKCLICEFKFAEWHHVFPGRYGAEKNEVVPLCPNHHVYANMMQAMIESGATVGETRAYATENFDDAFVSKMFYGLTAGYFHYMLAHVYKVAGYDFEATIHCHDLAVRPDDSLSIPALFNGGSMSFQAITNKSLEMVLEGKGILDYLMDNSDNAKSPIGIIGKKTHVRRGRKK